MHQSIYTNLYRPSYFPLYICRVYLRTTSNGPDILKDHYAFRPTGSITAAIVSILHHVTNILTTNPYVTLISFDFSKAFDTVRQSTLADKLSQLDMADEIFNWLVNFFQDQGNAL